ncbi:MAG: hypothetical protein ABH862_04380 [Candidatus Omnitrophota bacterium]
MISKERLLSGLHEAIYVEEGMVTMFTKFAQALINEDPDPVGEKKADIEKILHKLHQDSTKHKEKIEALIREVVSGGKHEY